MTVHHLAQINIARAKDKIDSETMKGFVNRLDDINALADNAPGFVWRLQTDDGNATSLQVFEDPMLLVNMSVWEDVESLKNFVYKSAHVDVMRGRKAWFHKFTQAHQALWWIPAGSLPTINEGKEKLRHLEEHGASKTAFTFVQLL